MSRFVFLPLALLALAVAAPSAKADGVAVQNFIYSYACDDILVDVTFVTEPIPAPTRQTFIPASELASYSVSVTGEGNYRGLYGLILNLYNVGDIELKLNVAFGFQLGDEFDQADFSHPGTYIGNFGTLKVSETPGAMPEPSTFAFITAGLVGVVFLKRRL